MYKNKLIVRYSICSRLTTSTDNAYAWDEISSQTTELLNTNSQKLKTQIINDVPVVKDGDITSKMENLHFEVRNKSEEKFVN